MTSGKQDGRGKVVIVQGAQYGSEGKGMITAMEAGHTAFGAAIRTGGPNSGHTVRHDGVAHVMMQIPTPWVHVGPKIILGPGALINPPVLKNEFKLVRRKFPNAEKRIKIHPNASVILDVDRKSSKESGRYYDLGGTSEGSSSAACRKILRDKNSEYARTISEYVQLGYGDWIKPMICDTTEVVDDILSSGQNVIIEGTQGCHLDILLGPYPKTTHRGCNTSMLLAEAGIAPTEDIEVILVARTYPIRVAGNSGHMPHEISWLDMLPKLGVREDVQVTYEKAIKRRLHESGAPKNPRIHEWTDEDKEKYPISLRRVLTDALNDINNEELNPIERTSVTNLVRRIAEYDSKTVDTSARWSGCTAMALTFTNYVDPGINSIDKLFESSLLKNWIRTHLTDETGSTLKYPLRWVNFGPDASQHIRVNVASM